MQTSVYSICGTGNLLIFKSGKGLGPINTWGGGFNFSQYALKTLTLGKVYIILHQWMPHLIHLKLL